MELGGLGGLGKREVTRDVDVSNRVIAIVKIGQLFEDSPKRCDTICRLNHSLCGGGAFVARSNHRRPSSQCVY